MAKAKTKAELRLDALKIYMKLTEKSLRAKARMEAACRVKHTLMDNATYERTKAGAIRSYQLLKQRRSDQWKTLKSLYDPDDFLLNYTPYMGNITDDCEDQTKSGGES